MKVWFCKTKLKFMLYVVHLQLLIECKIWYEMINIQQCVQYRQIDISDIRWQCLHYSFKSCLIQLGMTLQKCRKIVCVSIKIWYCCFIIFGELWFINWWYNVLMNRYCNTYKGRSHTLHPDNFNHNCCLKENHKTIKSYSYMRYAIMKIKYICLALWNRTIRDDVFRLISHYCNNKNLLSVLKHCLFLIKKNWYF